MTRWIPMFVVPMLSACCHPEHVARMSDATIVVAGTRGGGILVNRRPSEGRPFGQAIEPASRCIPATELLQRLGPVCSHESESLPPSSDAEDIGPGKPTRTREVRWYCDQRMDVRVVFEPCDTNGDNQPDGVTPVEIAVAPHQ